MGLRPRKLPMQLYCLNTGRTLLCKQLVRRRKPPLSVQLLNYRHALTVTQGRKDGHLARGSPSYLRGLCPDDTLSGRLRSPPLAPPSLRQ